MLSGKASLLALLVGRTYAAPVATIVNGLDSPAPTTFTHPMMSPTQCKAACREIHPISVHKTFGEQNKQVILAALYTGCEQECTSGYVAPVDPSIGCPTEDYDCLFDATTCDSYCSEIDLRRLNTNFGKATGEKHAIYTAMKASCKLACTNIPKTPATLSYPLGGRTPLDIKQDCEHIVPVGVHSNFGDDKATIMHAIYTGCEEAATGPYDYKAPIVAFCPTACKYTEDECDSYCGDINLHKLWEFWSGDGEKSEIYLASKHSCKKACANI